MNVEIGAEAALFPKKEYISGIFVAVRALPDVLHTSPTDSSMSSDARFRCCRSFDTIIEEGIGQCVSGSFQNLEHDIRYTDQGEKINILRMGSSHRK
jgi:hypothetical protein